MQFTLTQIAEILNIPIEQALTALQEAGIVYTEERSLSDQEVDKLRAVIFRHYRPRRILKKGGTEAVIPVHSSPAPISRMEAFVLDKKIMIDTCSLMHEKCGDLFQLLIPLLQKNRKKVIIPVKVINELKKLQFCFHDIPRAHAADRGMYLCKMLQDAGCLSVRGSENDNFADNVFFVTLSNYRYQHRMLLITQDRRLTYDVLQLNNFHSGGTCYPVEVMYITKAGELCVSDIPNDGSVG